MKNQKNQKKKNTKFVFVMGGVLSGVGKGITAASIGAILKAKGYKVSIQKCDPYLNVDAGLLNPVEHGECFVTHDGRETDLDLGHYERFLDFETSKYSAVLSGALYKEIIDKERSGGYHGKTVQMVPHFTDLVQEKIEKAAVDSDVHIVEIGGTVGDYEGLSFIEAIRLFANRVGRENCLYVHVVYVPWINTSKELKTKPAQNALKDLRGFGIIPDVVVCRTEKPAPRAICEKIAAFSGIPSEAVLNLPDIESVYDVPFNVLKSGVLEILNKFMGDKIKPDMSRWEEFSRRRSKKYPKTVKVGLVAKYVGNEDTYMCVTEALKAAAAWAEVNLEIRWINAEDLSNVSQMRIADNGQTSSSEDALQRDKSLSSGRRLTKESTLSLDSSPTADTQRMSNTSRSVTPSSSNSTHSKQSCQSAFELAELDGIVVPGGFGSRGVEGKIAAAEYALENDIPYLGLCLGMQVAVIAAARRATASEEGKSVSSSRTSSSDSPVRGSSTLSTASLRADAADAAISQASSRKNEQAPSSLDSCDWANLPRISSKMATDLNIPVFNSEEFGATEEDGNNVIYIMDGQKGKEETGGTMRLGDYPAKLMKGSKVRKIYGEENIVERHRHRYEVNQKFLPEIEQGGIVVSGTSPDGKLVEFVEAPKCKFFVATQAHPELKSRPLHPHPLFMEFIKAAKK